MRRVLRLRLPQPFAIPDARVLARALALGLVLLGSCKPKAGQDCSDTPGSCIDKTSHAVCVNKRYVIETCKGKDGCNDDGK
jgi:hypothetical protein